MVEDVFDCLINFNQDFVNFKEVFSSLTEEEITNTFNENEIKIMHIILENPNNSILSVLGSCEFQNIPLSDINYQQINNKIKKLSVNKTHVLKRTK